jgi:hypothetical protein
MAKSWAPTLNYLKIYAMADRFGLEKLKVAVIDFLKEDRGWGSYIKPKICDVRYIYEHTLLSKTAAARGFIVGMILYWFFGPTDLSDMLPGLMKCNVNFGIDLVCAIRRHHEISPGDCRIEHCFIHHRHEQDC